MKFGIGCSNKYDDTCTEQVASGDNASDLYSGSNRF
jgi:hypothetical protein